MIAGRSHNPDMSDTFRLEDDPSFRRVLYLGAFLLVVVPFVQAGSQLWPLQLGNIQWRFSAANALSSVLLLPFLGLTLLVFAARIAANRTAAKFAGAIGAVLSVVLLASLALFALDALQLKKIVPSQQMNAFNMTAIRVSFVTVLFIPSFALVGLAGLRSKKRPDFLNKKAEKGVGLIVGQEKA
jgi:hypothetical protein